MTGGPKRGQPRPPNIPSPVKLFRDEASKFGALWGYKRKLKSGHEVKTKHNETKKKQNKTKKQKQKQKTKKQKQKQKQQKKQRKYMQNTQFFRPNWPRFCIWEEFLINFCRSLKISLSDLEQNLLF